MGPANALHAYHLIVKIKAGSSVEQFRYAKSMHLMLTAEQFWIGISTIVQRQAIQIGKPKCKDEFMLPHHEPKKVQTNASTP